MSNPLLSLNYETAIQALGGDYYDEVLSAEFPQHILRFRNDQLLPKIGLNYQDVKDEHFIEAFGKFHCVRPFLALRYHGYQFGEYNPYLGDGRGFLYGQVRGVDDELYDFGTKGSGRTPYSRSADGRLTLKGGVREVLAAEILHRHGVRTSRCLSLIETGEGLWRGDEPSPTRSSVMVRFSRSHIRFGTFERLHFYKRPDLTKKLLNHVIDCYYSNLKKENISQKDPFQDCYFLFYLELVKRIAKLVAQWMAAGFCHGVLNTDNMSITGESFDYGPYSFIPTYNPKFTAAYFDYSGLYRYSHQPLVCKSNLQLLQEALAAVIDRKNMKSALDKFDDFYLDEYRQLMMRRLGFKKLAEADADKLLQLTIKMLTDSQVGYHDFFLELRQKFSPEWRDDISQIFADFEQPELIDPWRQYYYHLLQTYSDNELEEMTERLQQYNPQQSLIRPVIESVWEAITLEDNWQPFYDLLQQIYD
ncbi:MAG: YdiU family protein [Trichodesmium sp. St16_bin4-tuft]|nr:YdiU family protein [Trichodesmium sp. MAG_R01]MDE5072650.1 YdiU family protein [Trichodesmium sp. St5_bin8]MDE5079704.1 YdiU family protein [Trichodesmium sp. St2_bin6]MDE5091325.1 YdiU family protein [Trichodesmium sp. St18_bin3_1_1]MDE5097887.1 YdiU family protein [Trichodesmium sp. St16_bin4-tuft]